MSGLQFIAAHEGFVPNVRTISGNDTIGYGHVIQPGTSLTINGQAVTPPITQAQALILLQQDTAGAQNSVNNQVHVPLTQNQFDALVSYTYSTGGGGLANPSTTPFLSTLNSGDYQGAAQQWLTSAIKTHNPQTGENIPDATLQIIRYNEVNLFSTPDSGSYSFGGYGHGVPPLVGPLVGDVAVPGSWNQQDGGAQSQQAAQVSDSVANTSLNTSSLGKQFQSQQQQQATVLANLVNQMAQTPPLRMLINPRSFKNSLEKITADGNWGRNGPIIEHWGENLDKIEGSGKIAAFYALDLNPPNINTTGDSSSSGPGLSRMTRNYSASYQNFLSLYLTYRNNAGIWQPDYVNVGAGTASGRWPESLATVGSLYIYYDNILYVGCFDNFNITESDEAPFSLEYTFSFTVRAWFLLDQQQNPTLNYQPPAPSNPTGVQPQNGTVSTNSPVSQFGASGGQPSFAQIQAASGGVPLPPTQATGGVTAAEQLSIVP
jgi:GH24 family phage-related lysozyme (muramidase)